MAEFLTTRGTSLQIENIINNAKGRLVLISPFIRFPETLHQSLRHADRKGVKMTLVYGKRELRADESKPLTELKNISLYFLENLHAKCIFNEECMVITSMNLYDSSEQTNREMGVLITKKDDGKAFREAVQEARLIVDLAKRDVARVRKDNVYRAKTSADGYCIRCGDTIEYNLRHPLCYDCFDEWVEWENPEYIEQVCHRCGKPAPTTIEKPLCDSCYQQVRRASSL
jgi:phosphatidylserine/phosphatidylglycerophosphate/cardiolipin synthase-like enzyme